MKIEYDSSITRTGNFARYSKENSGNVINQFKNSIKRQVVGFTCPEHGLHPKVKVKDSNIDKIEFEVSGCCQQLIDIVNAKLR